VKRFMVVYNSSISAMEQMAGSTPEQRQEGMEAWMAWGQKAGDAIVDFGAPIQASARITPNGVGAGDSQASGYSILQGNSADEINALIENHPHLKMPGASIDVLELLPVPGS
jgi:hypothetical protein